VEFVSAIPGSGFNCAASTETLQPGARLPEATRLLFIRFDKGLLQTRREIRLRTGGRRIYPLIIILLRSRPAMKDGAGLEYRQTEPALRVTVRYKRGSINMQIRQQTAGFLALLVALSTSSAAPVFTWVDSRGITYFSDTPPTDESVSVNQVEVLPPPAAGMPVDADFYSVVNQAQRMETRRLLSEKLTAERLQAEAEASRARAEALAAEQPVILYDNEPGGYIFPYYPRYHHRPPGMHPPGGHKPGKPGKPEHYSGITIKPPPLSPALRILPPASHTALPESHRAHPY
jgi:hypothetical protein